MKWLPRENDLIEEQNQFMLRVPTENKNLYLSGFPGSGKSVCLLYAVSAIRKKNPNASILFVEYTHALIKMIEAALAELGYRDIKVVTHLDFERHYHGPYDYIICDEVQDMSAQMLALMQSRATRVIVGGDPNQSIYETMANRQKTASVDEMKSILNPVSVQLSIIHRLNKYIIKAVNSFMPDMHILAEKSSMLKMHRPAYVWHCPNETDEVTRVMKDAETALNYGRSVGILFSGHEKMQRFVSLYLAACGKPLFDFRKHRYYQQADYNMLNNHLDSHGIKMQCLTNGFGSMITDADKIVLLTYHSAKGLDFDKVMLPFCIPGNNNSNDPRLFMVAMSRSRDELTLSYTNQMNRFIDKFYTNRQACQFVDFTKPASQTSAAGADDDDW